MFRVEQRAASALLLNLGRAETTSLDLLTREFHFLFFTGQVYSVQEKRSCLVIMCWRSVCCEHTVYGCESCVTVAAVKVGVRMEVLDRAAATCVLTLCLGCLHVIALKSQLFTRLGGSPNPTEIPISYETFYFDQKVSLKSSYIFFNSPFVYKNVSFGFFLFCVFHFTLKCFMCCLWRAEFSGVEES